MSDLRFRSLNQGFWAQKKYKAYRKPRIPRKYNGRGGTRRLARNTYQLVQRWRPEMRIAQVPWATVAALGLLDAWTNINFFQIPEGQGPTDRTGDKAIARLLKMTFVMEIELDPAPVVYSAWYRIIIVQVFDYALNGQLTPIELFDDSISVPATEGDIRNVLAPYRQKYIAPQDAERRRVFHVLYDRTRRLRKVSGITWDNVDIFNVNLKLFNNLRFSNNLSTSSENPIIAYIWSNENGTTAGNPSIRMDVRYDEYFQDV